MNPLLVLGIALSLSLDAFAVSLGLAIGSRGLRRDQALRLALAFGAFQVLMAVGGWLAGENIVRFIEGWDHWVAFGLLAFVGGRMLYEAFLGEKGGSAENGTRPDRTRGWSLLLLAVATSIDSLAVGLSLGILGAAILYPAAVIGIVCFGLTLLGARLGPLAGRFLGRGAEVLGGVVLLAIGFKVLFDHLG